MTVVETVGFPNMRSGSSKWPKLLGLSDLPHDYVTLSAVCLFFSLFCNISPFQHKQ